MKNNIPCLLFCFICALLIFSGRYSSAQTIPQTNWALRYVDSQELGGNWAAINAFDGKSSTFWHTQWIGSDPPPPHEIQIDLGATYVISGFQYLPRQDGGLNGTIKGYEFYVSMDGTNWGSAVAAGTFAGNTTQKTITFTAVTGRYTRLRALSEINGKPWTSAAELNVLGSAVLNASLIPQTNWALRYVDSQESGGNWAAINAFDGKSSTFWHTQWIGSDPPPPHEIQIDLGATYAISGFQYLPRQDGGVNGTIKGYEFYVSMDGTNWGNAVATGTFAGNTTQKTVTFTAVTGRYTRLRALSEISGKPWTSAAEVNVLGSASSENYPPNSTIDSPAGNTTISAGEAVIFSGTGTDPDNNLPLSFKWAFGTGAEIPDATVEDPGLVQFNVPGTFTVTFTVTDALGSADLTPDTRVITVQSSGAVPQVNWRLNYVDSEELVAGNGAAANAFDGKANTLWHTDWGNNNYPPPHEIQIDLGATYAISGFQYLPRQDGGVNGTIKGYEFYVSMDGTNWGNAVATGTFAGNTTQKTVTFTAVTGRYARLQALSEINGKPWTSVAELNVMGSCVKPSVSLLTPWSFYLQPSTDLLVSANACLDSILQNGWGVRLSLDGQLEFDEYTQPFSVTFFNVSESEHTVTAAVIDGSGERIGGANTNDQAVQVGVGDYYVAMGDSITQGYGDDILADDVSEDGRNAGGAGYGRYSIVGGGYPPILNNLLTAQKGYPQTVENEGRGGTISAYGLSLLPAMLTKHPNAQRYLLLYGMNDAVPWLPVPSGMGLHPGDSGYAGTFKDNMQRIINLINQAGKNAVLAKIPIALANCSEVGPRCPPYADPSTGARSVLIQEYNNVIDELVSDPANNITVDPPDFFSYFRDNYATEYYDNIHPNGEGYRSMADLWLQVLAQ